MKIFFIPLMAIILFAGCASVKNTTQDGKMQISKATYKRWSEPPVQNSDVPEKGTDLSVEVKNWPAGASPAYIVYQKRKSFHPEITDSVEQKVTIEARIISASSVLVDRPGGTDVSDRLVYTTAKGDTSFIEIEEWDRLKQ